MTVAEFRKLCEEYAWQQIEGQKTQFKRLGVRGDWENPYVTLKPEFEAQQIKVFGEMAKKAIFTKGRSRFTGPLQANPLWLKLKSNTMINARRLSMLHSM